MKACTVEVRWMLARCWIPQCGKWLPDLVVSVAGSIRHFQDPDVLLLPPPASISYRMIGRLYDEADCANTVKVDAVGEQHRVDAEDNVNAHSCRYWHRVGELFPSISVFLSLLVTAHPYTAAQLTSSFSWKWNEHLSPSLSLVAYLPYSRHFSPSSPLPHSCPCSSSLLFLGSLLYYNN